MRSLITTLLLAWPALCVAADPAALVRDAISKGSATGTVAGPVAEEAARRLNATGPLTLKVTRLEAFQQPGCARVRLDFVQAQALLPGTQIPGNYEWSTAMNVCADGQAPASTARKQQ